MHIVEVCYNLIDEINSIPLISFNSMFICKKGMSTYNNKYWPLFVLVDVGLEKLRRELKPISSAETLKCYSNTPTVAYGYFTVFTELEASCRTRRVSPPRLCNNVCL